MSGAIAIFVKTPGLSPVKTRLAVKLGQNTAELFHLTAAQAIEGSVKEACLQRDMQGYFAVAEPSVLSHEYWQGLPCVWQGEGGLGERMAHIYQTLLIKHDFVILVGADIPQMTSANLLDAASWLSSHDHVRLAFGPSEDGGFWLFGGNEPIPHSIWVDVTYSVADTGAQFFSRIETIGDVKTLVSLCDVDELKDLLPLHKTLKQIKQPLPAQQALIDFLDNVLADF